MTKSAVTEEILNGKFHFLSSDLNSRINNLHTKLRLSVEGSFFINVNKSTLTGRCQTSLIDLFLKIVNGF